MRSEGRVRRGRTRALPELSEAADPPESLGEAGPRWGGLPQRWVLVACTSAAFVLCNMDKVRLSGWGRAASGWEPLTRAPGEHVCGAHPYGG